MAQVVWYMNFSCPWCVFQIKTPLPAPPKGKASAKKIALRKKVAAKGKGKK